MTRSFWLYTLAFLFSGWAIGFSQPECKGSVCPTPREQAITIDPRGDFWYKGKRADTLTDEELLEVVDILLEIMRKEASPDANELEEKEFPSAEAAIEYAVNWFLSGYEGKEDVIEDARKRAESIPTYLRVEGDFVCNIFGEHITLKEEPDAR